MSEIEGRLQGIKQKREAEKQVAPGMKPSVHIDSRDVDWLIQQAEKAESYEEALHLIIKDYDKNYANQVRLIAEEALGDLK